MAIFQDLKIALVNHKKSRNNKKTWRGQGIYRAKIIWRREARKTIEDGMFVLSDSNLFLLKSISLNFVCGLASIYNCLSSQWMVIGLLCMAMTVSLANIYQN